VIEEILDALYELQRKNKDYVSGYWWNVGIDQAISVILKVQREHENDGIRIESETR
jgi:hypothetical protein